MVGLLQLQGLQTAPLPCMTTPKVACSIVKLALHALEGHPPAAGWWESHDGGEDMRLATFTALEVAEILDSPEWLRFAFVRNPYERLFSAWKSKIANRWDTQYQPLRERLHKRYGYTAREGGPDPLIAFHDFVDFVVTGADDTYRGDSHWSAQVDVMWFDTINFDIIGRFETFTDDFCGILRRLDAPESVFEIAREVTNETSKIPLAAAFDRHLAGRVFEHYRRDFVEFGYPTDSWMYL